MPFSFAILLERVLNGDRLVHQKLVGHGLYSGVGGLEIVVSDETVTFGFSSSRISSDLYKG